MNHTLAQVLIIALPALAALAVSIIKVLQK